MATKTVPLEKSVVKSILKYLNGLDQCRARKVSGDSGSSGEPDIDCVIQGQSVKLEVKRPGNNRVTTQQIKTLEKWQIAGAVTGVVHSVQEVQELLKGEDILHVCEGCDKYFQRSWDGKNWCYLYCLQCVKKEKALGKSKGGSN